VVTQTRGVLSVMMPVYNEERTLPRILAHVLARPEVGEVVAVDDGSQDATWSILEAHARQDNRLKLFRHETNRGKGAALRLAIEHISMPFALVQDADLEYDPRDYPQLLEPLVDGRSDVVYGVRGFAGQTAYSFWFVVGNAGVTYLANLLFNSFIHDLETGYKALRSDLWKRLGLTGARFDIEPDITARLLRLGYRVHEVPIRYYARGREEGKKLTWKDGVQAARTLIRLRLARYEWLFPERAEVGYHRQRLHALARYHPLNVLPGGMDAADALTL
jgi:glycosyltransferase involved in cell wall biosynthesis